MNKPNAFSLIFLVLFGIALCSVFYPKGGSINSPFSDNYTNSNDWMPQSNQQVESLPPAPPNGRYVIDPQTQKPVFSEYEYRTYRTRFGALVTELVFYKGRPVPITVVNPPVEK